MKQGYGPANLAIAWEYNGRALEVVPARFSSVELICALDSQCGAELDTWGGIGGNSVSDLIVATNNFTKTPDSSTRLQNMLEVQTNAGNNNGSRMKGWLRPPVTGNVTGNFQFSIAANHLGEFWLSTDSDPANKVCLCFIPGPVPRYNFTVYSEQKSSPIPLYAGQAYYYEVRKIGDIHNAKHRACVI
jgi:hypothetical protein